MTDKKSPDEQPKRKMARQVMTPKQRYFVPAYGISVEAGTAEEAVKAAAETVNKQEEGDAE
jgi:hypothetical protein